MVAKQNIKSSIISKNQLQKLTQHGNYLERRLVAFHRPIIRMSLPSTVVSAFTSTTSRSGPVRLIRSHLEPVRFCARVCCTKSTGMPFLLASFLIFFFLSLLCRASRQFSTQTVMGNCGILVPLGNTTPSTLRHCSTNSWYLSRLCS